MSFSAGDRVVPRAPFNIPGVQLHQDEQTVGVVVRREATGLYTVDWDDGHTVRTGWTWDTLAPVSAIDRLGRLLGEAS